MLAALLVASSRTAQAFVRQPPVPLTSVVASGVQRSRLLRKADGRTSSISGSISSSISSSSSRRRLLDPPGAAPGASGAGEATGEGGVPGWLPDERLSLAPMMEYTDRHLRFLLRLLSKRMVLYTEMITAMTLHYNEEARDRFLRFNQPDEHPVVLQLGGADAHLLREASRLALPYGYDAINLNCGCPSERVSGSGCFGAALMREPALVAELCAAMGEGAEGRVPITVKCRIGVDDDDSYEQLAAFVRVVSEGSPVRHFVVHARKAILGGLSPEQNRKVPPLKYPFVYRLVQDFPHLRFTLNGGVLSYEDIKAHLAEGVHGVMVGRAITARPYYWSDADARVCGAANPGLTRRAVLEQYAAYAEREEAEGGPRLKRLLAKHVHNLFAGEPMGKRFRVALDQALLDPALNIRQVLEAATAVLPDELLDLAPGSPSILAPEAVRH